MPVLASFKSLDLKEGGKRYGVIPHIVSPDGLVTGKDAVKLLERFAWKGNSGVHRLYRDRNGYWVAGLDDNLVGFSQGFRVGRVSAVGSARDLRELAHSQIDANLSKKREKSNASPGEIAKEEREMKDSLEKMIA